MLVSSPNLVENPLVSVYIITYNQDQTISQTIESILMQEGDFSLELIIAEDGGTDNTRQICIEYQKKYPEKIILLLQDKNQGIVKNTIDALKLCRGQFIAVCAGDDYWIDNQKIAKQLQFFTKHPDYGVVSTGGYRLFVKKNKLVEGIPPYYLVESGDVFHLTHVGGVYAMPLSLLFRRELLKYMDFDTFVQRKFSVEDVPMQAIMAKHTKFGHIADKCVVYRVYNTSMTYTNFKSKNFLPYHTGLVEIKRYLDELYPGEVGFSEEWANDYLTYKRFLVAVYHFDFKGANHQLSQFITLNYKEKRAKLFSKTRLGFYAFCVMKRIKMSYNDKNF